MPADLKPLARMARVITDLSLFTPTNLDEERAKVLADADYEPRFAYRKLDFPLEEYREKLEGYLQAPQDEDARISTLVHERVRELLHWLELHAAHDNDSFTAASTKLYAAPSLSILAAASKDLVLVAGGPPERPLTAQDVKPRFEQALAAVGLHWPVVITGDILPRMHLIKGKELRINAAARFNELDVKKLIVHEVSTHAQRYLNGLAQENRIFAIGTAHFLETEEGLATLNEEKAGVLTGRVMRNLAARVVAVDLALKGSFADVYKGLLEHLPKRKAFEIALGVKRGLPWPELPGALTKAHIYYTGYQKVRNLDEEDLRYLYVGKVSVNHLPLVKELVKEGKVKLP